MSGIRPTIAFVIPHGVQLFYPEIMHKQGGAEVQLALIARELARRGEVRPCVLLGQYGQPPRGEVDGMQIDSFAHRPGLLGRISLWRALMRTHASAIVQRASGSMTANVAFYSLLRRVPFIYWAASDFDCSPDLNPDLDYPSRNRFFDWGLRHATAIIAQHEGQVGSLQKHLGRTPAAVIPNGWPAQPMPTEPRKHHLWIGHPTRHKNPEALLELAAAAPGERFIMVMPLERAHANVDAEVREKLKHLSNVEVRARVPFHEMCELYAQSKTHIITSLAEGFPNTLLQALWNGVPVLSLHVDPGAMLMKNGIGYCARGDLNVLIGHFKQLNSSPAEWAEASRRAYAFAAAELSISRVADRFMELLRELKILQ